MNDKGSSFNGFNGSTVLLSTVSTVLLSSSNGSSFNDSSADALQHPKP
jgi:hypothetical protein